MDLYKIINRCEIIKANRLYPKTKIYFYALKQPDISDCHKIYLLSMHKSSIENPKIDIICLEKEFPELLKKYGDQIKLIDFFYATLNDNPLYRLHKLIIDREYGLIKRIGWNNYPIQSQNKSLSTLELYVFRQNKNIEMATLSIIIWPPAYAHRNTISKILNNRFQIIESKEFTLEPSQLLEFVFYAYKDDLRCDKSNLPYKSKLLGRSPLRFKYIRFLIRNQKLDKMGVSKVSIRLKNDIRSLIKPFIKNYVHDIICHMSDNHYHSKNMSYLIKKITNGSF